MNHKSGISLRHLGLIGTLLFTLGMPPAKARDAAFMDPGASNAGADEGAIKVEPKAEIDTGESVLNVARRTTLFFINNTNQPVQLDKININGDGNVTTELANDDCTKQGTIAPLSRCSVEVSVTPNSAGPWSVDVLLTHNAAGRIARAKLTGKTTGSNAATEKKDTGLALSTKEVAPVNFGEVETGAGKAVRSALMINDSPEPITLYSIDVIEAGNGLQRLEQGCAIDMELKAGESCPVTLVWTPTDRGQISTDLIIRHSGRLGFAVIPIRGSAKGGSTKDSNGKNIISFEGKGLSVPLPPSAQDLEKLASTHIPQVSMDTLSKGASAAILSTPVYRLIGTVGNRAVLLQPDGTTAVVGAGEDLPGDGKNVKVLAVMAKSVDLMIGGKKKNLQLGAAPELTSKAANQQSSSNTVAADFGSAQNLAPPSATSLPGAAPINIIPPPSNSTIPAPTNGASK